jgi:Ca2+-binding RTX toxin-like protein
LNLSAFHAITIDLNVLGTDLDPLVGWQTLTDLAGHTAVIVLHGFFENVIGTEGADLLTGNRFANRFDGRGGNDTLTGLEGDDVLEGGAGDDTLTGGVGSDTYVFTGAGLGSDLVVEVADQDSDTLDFAGLAGAVSVDLGSPDAQAQPDGTFTLSDGRGLENVVGSAGSDTIIGNDRDNVLEGGAGDDAVSGGAGADTYRYVGEGLGTDTLTESGTDSDTLDFAGLLGGALITETVFGINGVGKMAADSIARNDQPVIMGVTLLAGFLVVVGNLVVDVVYTAIDPRVRVNA